MMRGDVLFHGGASLRYEADDERLVHATPRGVIIEMSARVEVGSFDSYSRRRKRFKAAHCAVRWKRDRKARLAYNVRAYHIRSNYSPVASMRGLLTFPTLGKAMLKFNELGLGAEHA
jgi:hypothetical protein